VSGKRRRTSRDARRRTLGQNFLVDRREIARLIDAAQVKPGELIVEFGPGRGALTVPIARRGGQVIAIEADEAWASQLHHRLEQAGLGEEVRVVHGDFRSTPLPDSAYRVISSPPFGLTTQLFEHLFDRPASGPWRADLLLQYEVARKRVGSPPGTLRSAAWAPWWEFELGPVVPATAFRPAPSVDAALLTVRRREHPVLPEWLAPQLRELLRSGWHPPSG
jgi:23S rRNA (adenine-N6)-dimethyltransferase